MSVSAPGSRGQVRRALLAVLAAGVAFAAILAVADRLSDRDPPRLAPGSGIASGESSEQVDPLAWDRAREDEVVAAAQRGFAHPLHTLVPGGVLASAARTARYRELIEPIAKAGDLDPDDLEALVYLESAGRPTAAADPRFEGAVGLTQIVAQTGDQLLDMRVDPAAARSLTRSIRRAQRRGQTAKARRLEARRRAVDERFDPPKALQGAVRYLRFARGVLDRDDLALASYHAGVGNLQQALKAYGDDDVSYAQLYFDTSPRHNAAAYRKLASLGDDSATYLWRLGAAKEIMRRYREDPAELRRIALRQQAKNSSEEVLWPAGSTERYRSVRALRAAYADGDLRRLPADLLGRQGVRIDPQMGELAPRRGLSRRLFRGLRPEALAVLVTLGAGTQEVSRAKRAIAVTSTVRDQIYQDLLTGVNVQATREYSLHTTGYAFDILRRFSSPTQEAAFWFTLRRLQALDMLAWLPEFGAIHVTAGPRAKALLPILDEELQRAG